MSHGDLSSAFYKIFKQIIFYIAKKSRILALDSLDNLGDLFSSLLQLEVPEKLWNSPLILMKFSRNRSWKSIRICCRLVSAETEGRYGEYRFFILQLQKFTELLISQMTSTLINLCNYYNIQIVYIILYRGTVKLENIF